MAFSIHKHAVIDHPAGALREFHVHRYECIDNLHFILKPEDFLPLPGEQLERYLAVAREMFKEAGWQGDGEIGLLWLPPFVFPHELEVRPEGVVLWHVKQEDDGASFLLSPIPLPFEEFQS